MSSAPHDEEVHVFEGTGIEEGNAPIPRWYFLVVAVLGIFFVVYMFKYLSGAQPSAAEFRHGK